MTPRKDPARKRRLDVPRAIVLILGMLLVAPAAQSRPEVIRPGMKYYSNEFFEDGLVKDIESEKNYEEIYQHYTYYETVYDAQGRVTVFKEYKQGAVILEEQYRYASDSDAVERTVLVPGNPPQVTGSEDEPDSQADANTVYMEGWEFDPVELTVTVGDSVVWLNDDTTVHDIAFATGFDSAPTIDNPRRVRINEKWTYTFDKPGVYKYTCKIHRKYDMNGVIVVKEP